MRTTNSALDHSERHGARAKHALRLCLAAILTVACLLAPISNYAVTVKHQATGTIQSRTPSTIVMLKQFGKHTSQWDFVLTHDTQIPEGVAKGARVTIYYHDDNGKRVADRIKVISTTPQKKAG
ncbi:MAG: hypothetical protein WBF06_01015 [Candidatus Acidiferrales bacterium]